MMIGNVMNHQGLLYCARYSVAPNFFGYCGPDKNTSLIDHLIEEKADSEVLNIFSDFDTLTAYLKLISYENKIEDPFDKKVVEAYWIGNKLLENISNLDYYYLLKEKLNLEKKLDINSFVKMKRKIMSLPFLPHHSFHVFNIFRRTGNDPSFHTLKTMDECRIGWGVIRHAGPSVLSHSGSKDLSSIRPVPRDSGRVLHSRTCQNDTLRHSHAPLPRCDPSKKIVPLWRKSSWRENGNPVKFFVETKPLIIENGKLKFGKPIIKKITISYKGKAFLNNLKAGDIISFHWGFACEVLNKRQVKNLEYYAQRSIDYFNTKIF